MATYVCSSFTQCQTEDECQEEQYAVSLSHFYFEYMYILHVDLSSL
jgi:hypothetical protein